MPAECMYLTDDFLRYKGLCWHQTYKDNTSLF